MISVSVTAHDEEDWLPATLDSIRTAADHACAQSGIDVETVVVDNGSTDDTAAVARDRGATVVHEPVRSIGRARNTGARHASGEVLVFVDADVHIPRTLLEVIHETMLDPRCVGGGVDTEHHPRLLLVRLHLRAWRVLAAVIPLVQGATQFCRRSAFEDVGGYPEDVWMGEDTDFYAELRRLARKKQGTVRLIRAPRVRPSSRRFDNWPLWKTLVWTNPLFIALFRRWKAVWGGWYARPVR
ncbi:MAG: glycosyltransferase [Gammaproteobacteria bacterium]|nr:glycosyltransferase [Gammaproteobacteria bacterium]